MLLRWPSARNLCQTTNPWHKEKYPNSDKSMGMTLACSMLVHIAALAMPWNASTVMQGWNVHPESNGLRVNLNSPLPDPVKANHRLIKPERKQTQTAKENSQEREKASSLATIPVNHASNQDFSDDEDPVALRYFDTADLTTKPQVLGALGFEDEAVLAQQEKPGSIDLVLLISKEGSVDDIQINQSSLPPPVVQSIVSSLRLASFSPGYIDTSPVRSRYRIEIRYEFGIN